MTPSIMDVQFAPYSRLDGTYRARRKVSGGLAKVGRGRFVRLGRHSAVGYVVADNLNGPRYFVASLCRVIAKHDLRQDKSEHLRDGERYGKVVRLFQSVVRRLGHVSSPRGWLNKPSGKTLESPPREAPSSERGAA
jgi:hypothetical protein